MEDTYMQVLFVGQLDPISEESVKNRIDKALQEGWSVVANTTVIQSVEYVPTSSENVPTTPSGTAFRTIMAIVLEKK